MKIEFDTNNITELDTKVLAVLLGEQTAAQPSPKAVISNTETKAEPTAKPAPKKAPAAKPEPVVEEPEAPTSEEAGDTGDDDLLGGQPTMADAVAAATQLVSSGGAAKVKEALAEVGAKRVSEMQEADIPAFLAALAA